MAKLAGRSRSVGDLHAQHQHSADRVLSPEHLFDYSEVVTERPRLAQREPRSLQPEQMGQLSVSTSAVPQRVHAWVLWEDGVEELWWRPRQSPGPGAPCGSGSEHHPTSMRSGSGRALLKGAERRVALIRTTHSSLLCEAPNSGYGCHHTSAAANRIRRVPAPPITRAPLCQRPQEGFFAWPVHPLPLPASSPRVQALRQGRCRAHIDQRPVGQCGCADGRLVLAGA